MKSKKPFDYARYRKAFEKAFPDKVAWALNSDRANSPLWIKLNDYWLVEVKPVMNFFNRKDVFKMSVTVKFHIYHGRPSRTPEKLIAYVKKDLKSIQAILNAKKKRAPK